MKILFKDFVNKILPKYDGQDHILTYLVFAGDKYKNFEMILPDEDVFNAFLFENNQYLKIIWKSLEANLPENFKDIIAETSESSAGFSSASNSKQNTSNAGFNVEADFLKSNSDSATDTKSKSKSQIFSYYKSLLYLVETNVTGLYDKINYLLLNKFLRTSYVI